MMKIEITAIDVRGPLPVFIYNDGIFAETYSDVPSPRVMTALRASSAKIAEDRAKVKVR